MAIDGRKIKAIRKGCHLTQEQLANRSGVDIYTIQYWERQQVLPCCNLSLILKIIETMDCSLQDIVEDGQNLRIRNKKENDR